MKKEVPNGGWGWMVVLGAAITNMVNQSLFSQFGLLFGDKLNQMGYGTVEAALVMNVNSMITNLSGLITGPVLKTYSFRKITLLGVFLTFFGMMLSSIATNLLHLIISYSIFTGLGLGLIMPSTFVAVNGYFTTRKGEAVGLSMAGTGVGQMVMPILVHILLDKYGFQGTTLVLAALCLNGIPAALLFHPVKWHMVVRDIEDDKTQHLLANTLTKQQTAPQNNDDINNQDIIMEQGKPWYKKVAMLLNLELLKDWCFIHLILGLSLVYTCQVAFSMIFPFFLQESVGLSRPNTALSMSLLSGADILARLTLPLITKCLRLSSRTMYLSGTLFVAICRSLLAQQTTFQLIIVMSLLCGYVRAAIVINQNLIISDYCGEQNKLPAALGLNMVTKGIIVLTVGQIFGWIRDYYESFIICIHAQSVVLVVVVLTWSLDIMIKKCLKNTIYEEL